MNYKEKRICELFEKLKKVMYIHNITDKEFSDIIENKGRKTNYNKTVIYQVRQLYFKLASKAK